MRCAGEKPWILSETPGRLRIHLPGLEGDTTGRVEARIRHVPGVQAVWVNPRTGNALVHFDAGAASAATVVEAAALPAVARRADAREGTAPWARRGRLLRAGLRGLVGHALVDAVLYTVAFAEPFGLPLAGLGWLHLCLDVVVWTVALAPLLQPDVPAGEGSARTPAVAGWPRGGPVPARA